MTEKTLILNVAALFILSLAATYLSTFATYNLSSVEDSCLQTASVETKVNMGNVSGLYTVWPACLEVQGYMYSQARLYGPGM